MNKLFAAVPALAVTALVGVTSSGALESSDMSILTNAIQTNGGTFLTNTFYVAGAGIVLGFLMMIAYKILGFGKLGRKSSRRR